MAAPDPTYDSKSAKALTFAAYASFVPIGIATVLLGPMLPILSARWSLNYSQAGALFTAQYMVSTVAVALSGVLVSRWGFRFAIKTGLVLMSVGVGLLLAGPKMLGIFCIGAYGGGLGLAVPAANLLVAEVNPGRRSATLNLLNFCWSAGAVACPFLVAAAAKSHQIPVFLGAVAGFALAGSGGDRGDACVDCGAIVERCITEGGTRDSVHAECSGYARGAFLSLCWGGERVRRMDRVVCEELGESDAVAGGDESVIFLCGADVGEMGGAAGAAIDR